MMPDDVFEDTLNEIENAVDEITESLSGEEYIYHYTSAIGLLGIIESHSIQLSNLKYLNDPDELVFSKSLFERAIAIVLPSIQPATRSIAEEIFTQGILDYADYFAERIFIFSTSLDKDSLHLWNYYGRSDGYNIEFRLRDLVSEITNKKYKLKDEPEREYSVFFSRVIYDEEKLLQTFIKIITLLVKILDIAVASGNYARGEEILKNYRFKLLALMYASKRNYHAVEKEYRICIAPDRDYKTIKHKIRNGIISPYIGIENNDMTMHGIGIGPMITDKIALNGLESLKKYSGRDFDIFQSSIKIR